MRPLARWARWTIRPSTWPIAVKLSLTLLAASLAPMSFIASYNLGHSLSTVEETEYRNLELLASGLAERADQLLADTRQSVAMVAGDAEVSAFLAGREEDRARLTGTAQQTLGNVVRSNPDIASVMLLDRAGACVLSTNPENLRQSYAYRDYFQGTMKGDPFVSELLTGSTTGRAGIYFAHPVTDAQGGIAGIAVLKLTGETLAAITESVHAGSARQASVVDAFGVVISTSDGEALYKSLAPLPAGVEALPAFQDRFTSVGVHRIDSLGRAELGRSVAAASGPAHTTYVAAGKRRIVGLSPMKTRKWTVLVEEPASVFEEPMALLARQARLAETLVGVLATVVALLIARTIVRPLKRLTAAAGALQRGDFDGARVPVVSTDELGVLAGAFNTMGAGLRERERERDMFGRVVSPEVREKLLGGELRLGGETLWVSVLFSDIRGFSTISEKMDPYAVVELLNEYMTEMAEAVRPFHGYINNFIGDAIVVVFGAPVSRPGVERLAVAGALAMRERLARLNERRVARGDAALATGIGVSAGEVVAGQIGSLERMLYTVIGDAVNVASRLETLTKDYPGHSLLVTGTVAQAVLADGTCTVERIGPVLVKGRVEPVEVYAIGPAAPREA